ncbi:MAG: type II secretion system protein GspD, partial [Deltaproteobacteria bacterium]|nr:type II secretion system protein GspD [Deltaproteobacteria bacterium]
AQAGAGAAVTPIAQELTGAKISITPFKAANSLIIMADPADYQNLVQVIERLDRRPKQVFVEAMITEVTVDKALELGTRFRVAAEQDNAPVAITGVGTIDSTAIQGILNGLAGLTIGGLGNLLTVPITRADGTTFNLTAPGFAVLFSLSEFKDIVNVLSTPHILTSDNHEAEIMVGENVPFLSSFERQSGTEGQPVIQSIERRDVGIRLRIKPKISEGDFVKLDIYQEISAISPTRTGGAADIITTKRSAQTSVVVKNNQTVVIGGLIQNRTTNNVTKVPLLGDIPLIGWLFKSSRDQNQKTNLLVFITPYIVEDFKGLEDLRERKKLEFNRYGPKQQSNGMPSRLP